MNTNIDINHELNRLLGFAIAHSLILPNDLIWAANNLIGMLGLHSFQREESGKEEAEALRRMSSPEPILERLLDWAAGEGLIEDTSTDRDLLDTKLMGLLTPRPSLVTSTFQSLRSISPQKATDWFYELGISSNYIRAARTARNICWKSATEFGELDVTINLSKPEKDPRDIARARTAPSSGYPQCLLCRENEGFFGHHGHPARQNLRLIPIRFDSKERESLTPAQLLEGDWYLQYSPYSYYNEHCIVLGREHVPMRISRATFENLLGFVNQFPHYFLGSNADLPIVGGSILSHDHYQGGRYVFAMDRAPVEKEYALVPNVKAGRVKWPMSALRLTSSDPEALIDLSCRVLDAWRGWSEPSQDVLAESGGEPHNTITPIARRRGLDYELDLVLRNNRTSEEHPLGIFHPHAEVHHIKKENIGLIEVQGLAILPPRLKGALEEMAEAWGRGEDNLSARPGLAAHDTWYRGLRQRHAGLAQEAVPGMLRDEVGHVFAQVLRDSGVYKRTPEGLAAFDRFIESLR
ncbi:MAG: UDP-glucose--hexose-1-phosphate uridylyltransferase [Fretibacterium sp.]|nr:UDP-glucose--hexose-1-phosphate uridylyltransferase [Fretibacterium sp.]